MLCKTNFFLYLLISVILFMNYLGKNGIEISAMKTHGDCLASGYESLSFLRKLINHQHFEQASLI